MSNKQIQNEINKMLNENENVIDGESEDVPSDSVSPDLSDDDKESGED